jgi:hypothetical protein
MIDECRSCLFFYSKEDHTLQYIVLSNEVVLIPFLLILIPLTFGFSSNINAVCIGMVDLILLMLLFSDPERSVNTSSS